MKPKLDIIKIGGNLIDDPSLLDEFLLNFAAHKNLKVLVHGGGVIASQLSRKLGVKTQMTDGRRITNAADLEIVTMVYAGLINKNLVARLQSMHCNAIGMSGCDMGSILSNKRQAGEIDFGFVGDVIDINTDGIKLLLISGYCPVFSAITHDAKGQLLNTNADTVAARLSVALSELYELRLIYCFEKRGVLSDQHDELSVIPCLNKTEYQILKKNKSISGGMIPKLDNCFEALLKGVSEIIIGGACVFNATSSNYTKLVKEK